MDDGIDDGVDGGIDGAALAAVRARIDRVDRQLVRLLATRKSLVEAAAHIKRYPRYVVDADRNEAVQANVQRWAGEFGLPEAFAGRVWHFLTALWIRHQIELMVRESGETPYAGRESGDHDRALQSG
ncbi:chorismate mutase [Maricaulis sp.]|uniref:chorismate mutase n=1 Tax=Maricaulis sp. TaxID=1486257 RepID=UPI003A92189A